MPKPKWVSRKTMPQIMDAIEATDKSTHVFYITSKGGEGKTVLLRQVGLALGSADGIAPSARWSGILDLYHSDVNSNRGLEAHLSQTLETVVEEFEDYREERAKWSSRRRAGLLGPELEAERAKTAQVFAKCVNKITRWTRLVIALDTTERIQYEMDQVQERCGMQGESTTVRVWLLDQLLQWNNCVVLLVGRPEADPYLSSALDEGLGNSHVNYVVDTLGPFDEQETLDYFELKKEQFPALAELNLDEAFYRRLSQVTEGRPIRLDLAVHVIQHGLGFDRLKKRVEEGEPALIRAQIDATLIDHVMRGEPDDSIRNVLEYLAVARKGLDAALLQHLTGEKNLEKCQRDLQAVGELGFVKRHAEDNRLYLHDEMYELCDEHLLEPERAQELCLEIVAWYERREKAAQDDQKRRDIQVDSLLYRLRADPEQGYQWYAQQAEYAIRAVQVSFDMRLRGEVIAFVRSTSRIDRELRENAPGVVEEHGCDSAARWVKRLMVRGQNNRAVDVAKTIKGLPESPCRIDDPRFQLACADLSVYQAQAMIYSAQAGEAVSLLQTTIAGLEGQQLPEVLAQQDAGTYKGWRRNMVLGRGHNNLGYAYWMHMGHLEAALDQFRAAITYFRASDLEEELANTHDNMGRVYALRRHPTRAASLVDDGLAVRRRLGRNYREGLSLNSRAIVHLEFEEFDKARSRGEQALEVFEGLGVQRGLGLASTTLGQALRRLGSQWESPIDADSARPYLGSLDQGVVHLDRAVAIFTSGEEPVRLVEALNELGSIYRERARLLQEFDSGSDQVNSNFKDAVRRLSMCVRRAKDLGLTVWYVDSCEDLAQVYFSLEEYPTAGAWLDRADKAVPREYKFVPDREPVNIPDEQCIEALWLQLGKIELLRGSLAYDAGTGGGSRAASLKTLEETVLHFLLSAAYFERYSPRAIGLQNTFGQMYDRLKGCSFDELRHLRETLSAMATIYHIDLSRPGGFFADTLVPALEQE